MIEELRPYAEYKNPSLPWLAAIPKHWEMIPNRALMKDQRQVVGERASAYTLLSLTLQGVIARDMVKPKGKFPAQFNTYKVVRPNDMIFCLFDIDETPRGVGLSNQSGMITGAYDVFSPTSRVDPRFLNHYYRFVDDGKLMKPLYTGLRKTIQRGTFAGLKTPCPPPDEQAAIVRFLDHANRKIDGFIRAKRKLRAVGGAEAGHHPPRRHPRPQPQRPP
jgi:type I restriction enzyme S subunit